MGNQANVVLAGKRERADGHVENVPSLGTGIFHEASESEPGNITSRDEEPFPRFAEGASNYASWKSDFQYSPMSVCTKINGRLMTTPLRT